jgi:hypothetical protein
MKDNVSRMVRIFSSVKIHETTFCNSLGFFREVADPDPQDMRLTSH